MSRTPASGAPGGGVHQESDLKLVLDSPTSLPPSHNPHAQACRDVVLGLVAAGHDGENELETSSTLCRCRSRMLADVAALD